MHASAESVLKSAYRKLMIIFKWRWEKRKWQGENDTNNRSALLPRSIVDCRPIRLAVPSVRNWSRRLFHKSEDGLCDPKRFPEMDRILILLTDQRPFVFGGEARLSRVCDSVLWVIVKESIVIVASSTTIPGSVNPYSGGMELRMAHLSTLNIFRNVLSPGFKNHTVFLPVQSSAKEKCEKRARDCLPLMELRIQANYIAQS